MKMATTAIWLAWKDWRYEYLISLCAVLALASMLSPLLILQGLKNGVTSGMRERLLQNPASLIITPKSDAGSFSPAFITQLAALPGAAYAIGRTRATASDITLRNKNLSASLALEPASPGEPILAKYHINPPLPAENPQIVLSAPAASALKVNLGDFLSCSLARRTPSGKLESMPMSFEVSGILPIAAADRKLAFISGQVLENMEDYRDYIAVPNRNWSGDPATAERKYASFRIYARSLNDVETIAAALAKKNIETFTQAREIAAIKSLESAINQIILIISIAVGLGFAAFLLSSSEGAIRRKKKMLGLLRLFGLGRMNLLLYPLTQTLLTAICGFFVSTIIYFLVAEAIKQVFSQKGALECELTYIDFLFAIAIVILISLLSSLRAAWQTANLEPSMVIREV